MRAGIMMEFTGQTKVYGLFGYPVNHSVSPAMHNRAFAALGLDCCYLPFRVARENLQEAVAAVRALKLGGVNVTIPHKEAVCAYLDQIQPDAAIIGAVNTIVNRDGCLLGYNTDAAGFLAALQQEGEFDPRGRRAVILGSGGAARAVGFTLALSGIDKIWIFDRDIQKAVNLAADLTAKTNACAKGSDLSSQSLPVVLEQASLLVNATPVGMYPNVEQVPPICPEWLSPGLMVYDLVYNPPQTRLLARAAERGCRVLSGIGMLTLQGARAFELWTGHPAPVIVMRRAVEEALQNQS
jgi:shikimate dehydrogenase